MYTTVYHVSYPEASNDTCKKLVANNKTYAGSPAAANCRTASIRFLYSNPLEQPGEGENGGAADGERFKNPDVDGAIRGVGIP
jgi:hypothetical protein